MSRPASPLDASAETAAPLTHEQIVKMLAGLLTGMFVAVLSGTVVSNALPTIVHDLGGSQGAYTGIVTATLLALTVSTPIWGKLSDLFDKKLLIQTALGIYVVGSLICAFAPSVLVMIVGRALQGVGAGGTAALTQVILAAVIPARQRGRYSGYVGATFALGTVAGPLLGGVIVDTSWLGWRFCFLLPVGIALLSVLAIQRTLHLTHVRRHAVLDLRGAFLIVASFSVLLLWTSLAGTRFAWASGWTAALLGLFAVLLALAIWAEVVAVEPVVPLQLFRDRTVTLCTLASVMVGVALFSSTVYLSQYFQLARGHSPAAAGLLAVPLVLGLSVTGLVAGRFITRTGRWKRWLVGGTGAAAVGLLGLGLSLRTEAPYPVAALFLLVAGAGIGASMQNLILAVQNGIPIEELGAATSTVSFFRSLGGAIGVSALGGVLGGQVKDHLASGLAGLPAGSGAELGDDVPNVRQLAEPVRGVVEHAYAVGIGDVFLLAVPLLTIGFAIVLCIRETRLRDSTPADAAHEEAVLEVEVAEAFEEPSRAR